MQSTAHDVLAARSLALGTRTKCRARKISMLTNHGPLFGKARLRFSSSVYLSSSLSLLFPCPADRKNLALFFFGGSMILQ
jgi:hypothetical protein